MNNNRRKYIQKIISELEDIASRLETLRYEEQESYGNMPEGLQQSDKGQASENAAGCLYSACSSLEDVKSELENSVEG